MFHISSLSIGITLALYMISLFESSYANIVGCDAVNCPKDNYNRTQCVIGNTTALEIGIHSFNISLLSPQPLTWTLATQAVKNQGTTVERDFLLGSPPSTNLQVSVSPSRNLHSSRALFSSYSCSFKDYTHSYTWRHRVIKPLTGTNHVGHELVSHPSLFTLLRRSCQQASLPGNGS